MSNETKTDDLEKEIILMEQELIFKRGLLQEYKKKIDLEISEHAHTKLIANKYMNENKELQMQLEVCLIGTQKLEEENKKNRDLLVKLQVELDAYLSERQQLLDTCYLTKRENDTLKNEKEELNEQLKGHFIFLENFKLKKSKTEALVTEIITKQEILNKEQIRLEAICKEGLQFTEKLSEEAKFQSKFVQEAKIGHAQMENEMVRLMAALEELKTGKESNTNEVLQSEKNYLELWKSQQTEMKTRNEELLEINQRLSEELAITKDQIEILTKKNTEMRILKIEKF